MLRAPTMTRAKAERAKDERAKRADTDQCGFCGHFVEGGALLRDGGLF